MKSLPSSPLLKPLRNERRSHRAGGLALLLILRGALCNVFPPPAFCQDTLSYANSIVSPQEASAAQAASKLTQESLVTPQANSSKQPVESEVIIEGLVSYGQYRIFASGTGCHLYTAGIEYDRHSWGRFLGARADYTAEILPLVLLREPTKSSIFGNPQTTNRQIVPGLNISPIGFRLMWRDKGRVKPYLSAKGGMIGFTQKVVSQKSTYESFSLQEGVGVQLRMNERFDLRLGLFSDFHFSNAFIVPVDPGLDVMNANLGLSYHFGQPGSR